MKSWKLIFSLIAMTTLTSACYLKHAKPYYVYAPDMHYSVALKSGQEGAMRPLVKGTVPRGFRPYSVVNMDEAKLRLNPVSSNREALKQGQNLFNSYCIACHGPAGEGNGLIAALPNWPRPLYPRPPSLQSEKIRDYKDGEIFHVITMGQNLMPSYAEKLSEEERWEVIHYVRALYRSKHPSDADMKQSEGFVEDNL
ncbi:MAG: cytochrome c [Bdellovibrionales bacterium]|nr:cytochrome c [Oligoflexia bacterium]